MQSKLLHILLNNFFLVHILNLMRITMWVLTCNILIGWIRDSCDGISSPRVEI